MPLYHRKANDWPNESGISLDQSSPWTEGPMSGISGFYLSDRPGSNSSPTGKGIVALEHTVYLSEAAKWLPTDYPAPDWLLDSLRAKASGSKTAIIDLASGIQAHATQKGKGLGRAVTNFLMTENVDFDDLKRLLSDGVTGYPGDPAKDVLALESKLHWLRSDAHNPPSVSAILKLAQRSPAISTGHISQLLAMNNVAGLKWRCDDQTVFCALTNDPSLIKVQSPPRTSIQVSQSTRVEPETSLLPEVLEAESRVIAAVSDNKVLYHSADPASYHSIVKHGLRCEAGAIDGLGQDNSGSRAVMLATEPEGMTAVAARNAGKPPGSKLSTAELAEHAVLCICHVNPDTQPIYRLALDEFDTPTGASARLKLDQYGLFPTEIVSWSPAGAGVHDIYTSASIDPEYMTVLQGVAALQYAVRNAPHAVLGQIIDPENLAQFACQFEDARRHELITGQTPEPHHAPGPAAI